MSVWTQNPELVDRLRELQAQGFSAGRIAEQIGVTRCAVIGKLHRIGLRPMSKPPRDPNAPRKPRNRRIVRFSEPPMELPACPEIAPVADADIPMSQRRTLVQLGSGHCKWPVGDPQQADFFFCAAARVDGKPYCAAHCRMAYDTTYRKRRPFVLGRIAKIAA